LKKENFGLKMRVYFLDERLSQVAPENMEKILQENIDQKVENESLHAELDNTKKILQESKKVIEHLRKATEAVDQSMAQKEEVIRANEAKLYQGTIKSLEEKLQIYENELRFAKIDIETMGNVKNELDERLAIIERELQEKDEYMEYLKQHTAEELTTHLGEKQDEIVELRSKLDEYEDKIGQLEDDVSERDHELKLMHKNQKDLIATMEKYKEERDHDDDRDELINELRDDIENHRKQERLLEEQWIDLKEELLKKDRKINDLSDVEKQYVHVRGELDALNAKYINLTRDFEWVTHDRDTVEERLKHTQSQLERYLGVEQRLTSRIHELEDHLEKAHHLDQNTQLLTEQLRSSMKACQEKETALAEMDRSRHDLEDRLTLFNRRFESTLQELSEKTELIRQLEHEKLSLEDRVSELNDRTIVLTSEVRSKTQMIQDYKLLGEQLRQTLQTSEKKLMEKEDDLARLRYELEQARVSTLDMGSKVSELEFQLNQMTDKHARDLNGYKKLKEQEIEQLREALRSFEEGRHDEGNRLRELLQKLSEKDEEILRLRGLLQTLESKEREIHELTMALKKAQTDLLELNDLKRLHLMGTSKEEEIESLHHEIVEKDGHIAQLEHDLDHDRIRNEDNAVELRKLKDILSQKQLELMKVQSEMERKTEELIQSRNDIFTKNVELARSREFVEATKFKDEEIARLNDALKSSLEALKSVEFHTSSSHSVSSHRMTSETDSASSRIPLLIDQIRSLSSQLEAANVRNDKLHDLLLHNIRTLEDAHLAAIHDYVQRIENLVTKNDLLRNDIMERTRELEESRFEARTFQHENASLNRDAHRLKKRLSKREALISKALQRLERIHQLQQESYIADDSVYRQIEGVESMIRTNGILDGEASKKDHLRLTEPPTLSNWRAESARSSLEDV
jgi:chromosome segregation ATPase